MKKLVRCKACGYIMEEGKLGDRCPACGAPKAAFVEYTDPMNRTRRRLLKWELHPIAVHFPVSFAVAVLVFSIIIAFMSGDVKEMLVNTTEIMVLFIPVLVIVAGVAGYIDGKVRFRKIRNSRILKKKILYSSFLFVIAAVLAVTVWTEGFDSIVSVSLIAVLAAVAVVLISILALLGTSITESAFAGD
jgi:uncharacterized membrane protein